MMRQENVCSILPKCKGDGSKINEKGSFRIGVLEPFKKRITLIENKRWMRLLKKMLKKRKLLQTSEVIEINLMMTGI
jgi:hypothetical protein